jgi:hypothetical protein
MPRLLAAALFLLAIGVTAQDAHAFGPFCFQLTPFPNVVVWFVEPTGGNQFEGSGRDLAQNAAQSVHVVLSGNTATVTFVSGVGTGATSIPYVASVAIDLAAGSGPGRYYNLRPEGIVTSTFTAVTVACPANALALGTPDPGRFPGTASDSAPGPTPPAAHEAREGLLARYSTR